MKIFSPAFVSLIHTLMVASRPRTATPSLLDALRQYRSEQAYIRAVPPSTVFTNKLLTSINYAKPNTVTSLLKLSGIGPARCQHYGRDIVRLVNLDAKKKAVGKTNANNHIKQPKARGKKILKPVRGKPKAKTAAKATAVKSTNINTKSNVKITKSARRIPVKKQPKVNTTKKVAQPPSALRLPGSVIPKRLPNSPKSSVYVLELEDGRVYVGSSKDVPRRISQHASGYGSAYTRLYRPTGVQLPRLGNIEGDGDAAERDETLRYMMIRGIPFVRGWKFARVDMPAEEFDEAEANIRELFDLCRRCGYKGHFCTHCKATFDRLGNPVKR